jgi:ADP-ribosylglycohydrolase
MKTHLFELMKVAGFIAGLLCLSGCAGTGHKAGLPESPDYPVEFSISKTELMDKIMGGWAGQTIGCTYGGPTEFRFKGTMIQDYTPIVWDDTRMDWYYNNSPGLYDDIYMDLTFVEVIDKEGIDAPASSHANAFANAEYALWHANQSARYNILGGIMPPASGHWENNPHADDIDFQIEADFAGLMSPGMVNPASEICDRVGHIMNYGDGWYGGVYVAAMYALAFYTDDIELIVSEGLKSIPAESGFYQCMTDVIQWYYQYPEDWKQTWFETEKKWSSDVGCPNGVFKDFNIDARINAAYIVIGLLYGEGDFGKTVDISTRCGQDSDCNPASSGGILGTVLGYNNIPEYWKQGIEKVEGMDFKYTSISLRDAYEMSHRHSVEMIKKNGGKEEGDRLTILLEEPEPVRFEKAFDGHFPVQRMDFGWDGKKLESKGELEYSFDFSGIGFVLLGRSQKLQPDKKDLDLLLDVYIDGELYEQALLPTYYLKRRNELTWKYNLTDNTHNVRIVWRNPTDGYGITMADVLVYSPQPVHSLTVQP